MLKYRELGTWVYRRLPFFSFFSLYLPPCLDAKSKAMEGSVAGICVLAAQIWPSHMDLLGPENRKGSLSIQEIRRILAPGLWLTERIRCASWSKPPRAHGGANACAGISVLASSNPSLCGFLRVVFLRFNLGRQDARAVPQKGP